jgi:hypothetical protein
MLSRLNRCCNFKLEERKKTCQHAKQKTKLKQVLGRLINGRVTMQFVSSDSVVVLKHQG